MELCLKVRRAHFQDGLSGRQIARDFGISRDSVSKMLSYSEPPGYRRTAAIKRPKLDAYVDQIDQWLVDDKCRPRKQRHTAKRIFERLRDECGFNGGYTIVKDYVRSKKRGSREMFVLLSHPPGHTQADFGEALVIIGGIEQKAYYFALDLPRSGAAVGALRQRPLLGREDHAKWRPPENIAVQRDAVALCDPGSIWSPRQGQ